MNIQQALKLVLACEADLKQNLTVGEMTDLLLDNWDYAPDWTNATAQQEYDEAKFMAGLIWRSMFTEDKEAFLFLMDSGAATHQHVEPDFDDGDSENGPGTSGHPAADLYFTDSHIIAIEWRGMLLEPRDFSWEEYVDQIADDGSNGQCTLREVEAHGK